MMATQATHFDINAYVRGSQRLDQEKKEINLVMRALYNSLYGLLSREVFHRPHSIPSLSFAVKDKFGHSLTYATTSGRANGGNDCFEVTFCKSDNTGKHFSGILSNIHREYSAEQLSLCDVGACHGLLSAFVDKVMELSGNQDGLQDFVQVFYDAAKRAETVNQ